MIGTKFEVPDKYRYQNGFGNHHETEALPETLPVGMNSPQKPAHGLYTEKLSGTAFTAPRHENLQTWLYRILPSSVHTPFRPCKDGSIYTSDEKGSVHESVGAGSHQDEAPRWNYLPNQLRWDPFDLDKQADWVQGTRLIAGAGDPTLKSGLGISVYAAGCDMPPQTAYFTADGDLLIVPQQGVLDVQTELGKLLVRPGEIAVIPRGIRHRVTLPSGPVRGYILELYQGHFLLPELGPIGSNGLANARDFQAPVAAFDEEDDREQNTLNWTIVSKFANRPFVARQTYTPFDVVAWHGTYYPYKYDLGRFNTIGTISHDHPDPSIFTVLTAPSSAPGTAVADFVIFPPRWAVAGGTFRPPWYHRNTMSEFMGLITGQYDGKAGTGFRAGGASLHNVMGAHGPDRATFERASEEDTAVPARIGDGGLAFMFETMFMLGVSEWALRGAAGDDGRADGCGKLQAGYNSEAWQGLERRFRRPAPETSPSG
jgi:homogentisate 1,2-dioxygenase